MSIMKQPLEGQTFTFQTPIVTENIVQYLAIIFRLHTFIDIFHRNVNEMEKSIYFENYQIPNTRNIN